MLILNLASANFLVGFFTHVFHIRFKIEVDIDYYPKNFFLVNVFNEGIFIGEIWKRFISEM